MALPPIKFGTKCNRADWPEVDSIDGAVAALRQWCLDPRLDNSGSPALPNRVGTPFSSGPPCYTFGQKGWNEEAHCVTYSNNSKLCFPYHPNTVQFVMNFIGYSFGGTIWTEDEVTITRLREAIKTNMMTWDYKEAAIAESAKRAKRYGVGWKGWPAGHPCYGLDAYVVPHWTPSLT
jgi:hypothetical protein